MLTQERSRKSVCSTDNNSDLGHGISHMITTQPQSSPSNTVQVAPPKHTDRPASASVRLETLLVGGQRKTWRFDPQSTVATVRQHIWNNWPQEWPQPRPHSDASLRVLHLGHILDDASLTLASRGMRVGAVTVVHLVIRSALPSEPSKTQQDPPVKKESSRPVIDQERTPGCSCVIC